MVLFGIFITPVTTKRTLVLYLYENMLVLCLRIISLLLTISENVSLRLFHPDKSYMQASFSVDFTYTLIELENRKRQNDINLLWFTTHAILLI